MLGGICTVTDQHPHLITRHRGGGRIIGAVAEVDVDPPAIHSCDEILGTTGRQSRVLGDVPGRNRLVRKVRQAPLVTIARPPSLLQNGLSGCRTREIKRQIHIPCATRHRPAKKIDHVHGGPVHVTPGPLPRAGVIAACRITRGLEVAIRVRADIRVTLGWIKVPQVAAGRLEIGVRRGACWQRGDTVRTGAEVRMAMGRGKLHRQRHHHIGRHTFLTGGNGGVGQGRVQCPCHRQKSLPERNGRQETRGMRSRPRTALTHGNRPECVHTPYLHDNTCPIASFCTKPSIAHKSAYSGLHLSAP